MAQDINALAQKIHTAIESHQTIAPLSSDPGGISLAQAYEVANGLRSLQGRQRVGFKVGFTNRAIWEVYGVNRPIWGVVSAETLTPPTAPVKLVTAFQPRIEPEIVLGLSKTPEQGMDRAALAGCIDWVAPGFEIVQTIYPDWKMDIIDSVAAQALHVNLVVGEMVPATPEVLEGLTDIPVDLMRGDEVVETGVGANALDGPLDVLAHLVDMLDPDQAVQAGELVSTGTLTDAWRIEPGEEWTGRYGGVMGKSLTVRFE